MAQKSKRNSCSSPTKILSRLTEIFPSIPGDLFYPFLKYNESQLTDLVMNLIYMEDNSDQMEYLLSLRKQYQNKEKIDSSNYNNKHHSEAYEDELLAALRRSFGKDTHNFFDPKLELKNANTDNISPEITEKNWEIPEDCYQSHFEYPGLMDLNKELKKPRNIYKTPEQNVPSLREVMDSEEAIQNSIKHEKDRIKNSKELSNKIDILQSLYPQISRDELENKFIYYDMDINLTNSELSRIGFSSTSFPKQMSCSPNKRTEKNVEKLETKNLQQILQEIEYRIESEKEVIEDIKHQLSIRGLNTKVKGCLKDELSLSIDRIRRLEKEFALASSSQQSVVSGNLNLDLHGFTCQAAVTVVKQRLSEIRSSGTNMNKDKYITIICGRGLHNNDRKSRLKPAIEEYLNKKGISYFETFEGTFRIYLKQFL